MKENYTQELDYVRLMNLKEIFLIIQELEIRWKKVELKEI